MVAHDKEGMVKGAASQGAAIYSKPVLAIFDLYATWFSNTYIWMCPPRLILDFYNQHISAQHLDLGVGTGYYLDRCSFPSAHPDLAIVDLNPNSLQVAIERLQRYKPTAYQADVLKPLPIKDKIFTSIGLSSLLHCLPGTLKTKKVVFQNIKLLLNPDGVVFGTTLLGKGIESKPLARKLMEIYNSKGIFSNRDDDLLT